jgi:RNase P/RNase MRP subunit p29
MKGYAVVVIEKAEEAKKLSFGTREAFISSVKEQFTCCPSHASQLFPNVVQDLLVLNYLTFDQSSKAGLLDENDVYTVSLASKEAYLRGEDVLEATAGAIGRVLQETSIMLGTKESKALVTIDKKIASLDRPTAQAVREGGKRLQAILSPTDRLKKLKDIPDDVWDEAVRADELDEQLEGEKGGAGSGNWGHSGRPGLVGGSGGRAGASVGSWVVHDIGGGKGKSRRREVRKATLSTGVTVMAAADKERAKRLPATQEIEDVVQSSKFIDLSSDVNAIEFKEKLGEAGQYLVDHNRIRVAAYSGRDKRTVGQMARTLDHELAHHVYHKLSTIDTARVERVMNSELSSLSSNSFLESWQVKLALRDGNTGLAASEYFAKSAELYAHSPATLKSMPQTVTMVEELMQ